MSAPSWYSILSTGAESAFRILLIAYLVYLAYQLGRLLAESSSKLKWVLITLGIAGTLAGYAATTLGTHEEYIDEGGASYTVADWTPTRAQREEEFVKVALIAAVPFLLGTWRKEEQQ